MNELNKKIESMLEHSLPIMPDYQVDRLTKKLSKFFLEEIKEAFERSRNKSIPYDSYLFDDVNDYLKSKYKI